MTTEEKFRAAVMEAQDKAADTDQEDLDAVFEAVAEIERLQDEFVPEEFVPEEPPDMSLIPAPVWEPPRLTVTFDEKDGVSFLSNVDRKIKVSGRVRDGSINLKAGKAKRRKLTNEPYDVVTVDGVDYPIPTDGKVVAR